MFLFQQERYKYSSKQIYNDKRVVLGKVGFNILESIWLAYID